MNLGHTLPFLQRKHTVTTSKLMQQMPYANYHRIILVQNLDRIMVLFGSFQKKKNSRKKCTHQRSFRHAGRLVVHLPHNQLATGLI